MSSRHAKKNLKTKQMKTWGAKIIRDRMGDAEKKKLGTE
jgi:hypothetical protein